MEALKLSISIGAAVVLGAILLLIVLRNRLGVLNTASWLVILGAVVILPEHPQFAVSFAVPFTAAAPDAVGLVLIPHAQVHFAAAGVYAAIGLALLCVIARTLLLQAQPVAWFTILATLLVGTTSELLFGALWFPHGAPWFAANPASFGWEWLYLYPVAWLAALFISYRPIFGEAIPNRAALPKRAETVLRPR